MPNPHTHALRRVPAPAIALVPSWGERLARLFQSLFESLRESLRERLSRAPREATRDELEAGALRDLSPHLLADIGAPETMRQHAEHERALRRQRLLELEQGHRAYQDARW